MSSPGLPFLPILSEGPPAPIESSTLSKPNLGGDNQSNVGAAFRLNYGQSPVVTEIGRAWGSFQDPQQVSHDDAVRVLKSQGYDSAFVPKDGMSQGAINAEVFRQYQVKRAQIMLERGGAGGFSTTAGALAAGFGDPSNLALGPALGVVGDLARGGLAVRAGVGAVFGAAYTGAMESAQAHLTGHDEDINSWEMLNHLSQGAAFFGIMHGALGPRVAPETVQAATGNGFGAAVSHVLTNEGGTTVDTGGLTKFGISAKAHPGLDIANLSQADAVKIYKSEYWDKINGDKLPSALQNTALDAAVNQGVDNANHWIKESGGDVGKFNALRKAHYEELARSDPAKYGKYLQTWVARVDNQGAAPPMRFAAGEDRVTSPASLSDDQVGELRQRVADLEAKESRTPEEDVSLASVRALMQESADSVAEKQRLAQVALAQFEADNPVNVDPFRSGTPTDPIAARAVDDAARGAAPDPTRNTPSPSTKPIIMAVESKQGEPSAMTQQFIKDAKARVTNINPDRGEAFDEAVKEAPLENEEGTKLNHDDFTKAVQAAVNCTVATGAKLAVE